MKAIRKRETRMKKEFSVTDLCIEVTRRCNMQCEHCLRGDAENKDIQFEYIKNAISVLNCIRTITFTGGEPSLNIPAIRYTMQELQRQNKQIENFYVVTNGLENQSELAVALLEFHTQTMVPEADGVALSIDMFHAYNGEANPLVRGLSFYACDKEHDIGNDTLSWVISRGRAEDNGFGEPEDNQQYEFPSHEELYHNEFELLYLSVTGRVYPEGNASYQDMDEGSIQSMDCRTKEAFEKDLQAWLDGKLTS